MNKHQKISLQIKLKKETSTVATIGNQSLEEKAKATKEGEKSNPTTWFSSLDISTTGKKPSFSNKIEQ